MINEEIRLCGYFVIITSEKMTTAQAKIFIEFVALLVLSRELMEAFARSERSFEEVMRFLSGNEVDIEQEYNIPVSQEFREEVKVMCNLSTGIEERATKEATEETSEKFILNMHRKGYTLEQIADVAETSVDEIEAVIRRKETIIV